jgi:hypothetical protein
LELLGRWPRTPQDGICDTTVRHWAWALVRVVAAVSTTRAEMVFIFEKFDIIDGSLKVYGVKNRVERTLGA